MSVSVSKFLKITKIFKENISENYEDSKYKTFNSGFVFFLNKYKINFI